MREDLRQSSELRAHRRRAYEELNLAIDQSGDELPSDWLANGDRDLQALRMMEEPEWLLLVRRQSGEKSLKDPQFPGAAWGDPHRRRNEWIMVALALFVLAAAITVSAIPREVWIGLGAVAVVLVLVSIWMLARRRGLILGGILLAGAALWGITEAPVWFRLMLALIVAGCAALYRADRAATLAKAADAKSVALWNRPSKHDGDWEQRPDDGPAQPEPRASKPTDPDPPVRG